MIQRIQSLYLIIIVLLSLIMLPGSVISFTGEPGTVLKLSASGILLDQNGKVFGQIGYEWPVIAILIFLVLLSLATMFMFRNRKLQLLLSIAVIIMSSGLVAALSWYILTAAGHYKLTLHPDIRTILPVIILIFSILAYRGIRKDDRLVKSYDRLR